MVRRCLRFDEVFELPAELEVVAVGKLHLLADGARGLLDEAGGVASAHVDEHADAALGVLADDLHGLLDELHLGDLAEREQAAVLGAQRQALHRGDVVAAVLGEAHDDGRAAVAFDERADFRRRRARFPRGDSGRRRGR